MMPTDECESHEIEQLRSALAPPKPFELSLEHQRDLVFAAGIAVGKKNVQKKMLVSILTSVILGLVMGLALGFGARPPSSVPQKEILIPSNPLPNIDDIWTIYRDPVWVAIAMEGGHNLEFGNGQEWTIGCASKNWDEIREQGK